MRTMENADASPSPLPFSFVVKNGSNIFGIFSGGMPTPLSLKTIFR